MKKPNKHVVRITAIFVCLGLPAGLILSRGDFGLALLLPVWPWYFVSAISWPLMCLVASADGYYTLMPYCATTGWVFIAATTILSGFRRYRIAYYVWLAVYGLSGIACLLTLVAMGGAAA